MAPKSIIKYQVEFLVPLLALVSCISGCEPTAQPKGSSGAIQAEQRTSQSDEDEMNDEDNASNSAAPSDKGTKKKTPITKAIDAPSDPQTAGSPPPSPEVSSLGKSSLNWNGTSLIGTQQLFLIPIE